jgi:hypothetical protein
VWRAWALFLYLSLEHRRGPKLYFGGGLACADERAICSRTAVVIVFRFERAASTAPVSASIEQPVKLIFLVFRTNCASS